MANEQRMRAAMLKASGAQRIYHRSVILTNLTDHRTRSLLRQDAQAESHERQWSIRFVRMRHQPELVGLGTAPEAQSNPAAEPHAAIIDAGKGGRLERRQMPRPRTTGAGVEQFIAAQALGNLHTAWGGSIVEAEQSPNVVPVPAAQRNFWHDLIAVPGCHLLLTR
jgi:hypothetical protein